MPGLILAVNAGSSSVKASLYKVQTPNPPGTDPTETATCEITGLTAPPPSLSYSRGDYKVKGEKADGVKDHGAAFKKILERFVGDDGIAEVQKEEDIAVVCHRIVHGGDFEEAQVVDKHTYDVLERLSDLAPLHNAPALGLVHAVHEHIPQTTNLAFFDTSFHATLPAATRTYPISPSVASRNKLRKYGFHGLSYGHITRAASSHLRKPARDTNLVALHLGSGASACAIRAGASADTSMGLTPLAGLPGATRSGSVDPSLVFHYTHAAGAPSRSSTTEMHITQAEEILNKESGWKALTGTTDFGVVSQKAEEGDGACMLAFDIVVDRVVKEVAKFFVGLEGRVDALVFAGGIGEKGVQLRREVVRKLACLGFAIDESENEKDGKEAVREITAKGAKYRTLIVQTDEQLQMARGCVEKWARDAK